MAKLATVKFGPSVWFEKSGPVTREDDEFVWVMLQDRDDGKDGLREYELKLPKGCVTLEVDPPT